MKRLIASLSVVGCLAFVPVAVAHADCDTPGDFGAGAGCEPPGSDSSGSGGTATWPPTSVDWPPQFESALDGGDTEKSKAAPIVTPDGAASQSGAEKPAPIVGAGSGSSSTSTSTSTTSTPIVMPGS